MGSIFKNFEALSEADKQAQKDADQSMAQTDPNKPVAQEQAPDPVMDAQGDPEEEKYVPSEMEQQFAKDSAGDITAQDIAPQTAEWANNIVEGDPNTWNPKYTQMGFAEKAGESILRGTGDQVIGGVGDMMQSLQMIMGGDSDGTMVSRWFQEAGDNMADQHQTYQSEALRKQLEENAWNWKTFMHADFWSTSVAEGVPMLVEMILLSKGASAIGRGLVEGGLKAGAKALGKQGVKDTVSKVVRGAGKDIGGLKLGKLGAGLTDFVSGGASMNVLAGLMNAAELVNTHKEDRNEDGSKVYTDEQLGEMASASFTENLKYLPIDMLSWGVSYGMAGKGITKGMKGLIGKTGKKMFTPQQASKSLAMSFVNKVTPYAKALSKVSTVGGKAFIEGYEETFQESFEEWAKIKGKAKVDGSKAPDYFDFYNSKENEMTKAVSFALGALGGGTSSASNMISGINKAAEESYSLYDKGELLKKMIKNDDIQAKAAQEQAIHEMLINNKYDGRIDNATYIQEQLIDQQIVDEEEGKNLLEKAKKIDETWDNAKIMNIKGKIVYANSVMMGSHIESFKTAQQEEHATKVKAIKESKASESTKKAKIEEATKELTEQMAISDKALAFEAAVQERLLAGDGYIPSHENRFLADEDGNQVLLVGLSPEKYHDYYDKTDEEIFAEAKANPQRFKNKNSLYEKVKQGFTNLQKQVFKENQENETKSEELSPEDAKLQQEAKDGEVTDVDRNVAEKGQEKPATTEEGAEEVAGENGVLAPEEKTEDTKEITPNKASNETVDSNEQDGVGDEENKNKDQETEQDNKTGTQDSKSEVPASKGDNRPTVTTEAIKEQWSNPKEVLRGDRKAEGTGSERRAKPLVESDQGVMAKIINQGIADGKTSDQILKDLKKEGFVFAKANNPKSKIKTYLSKLVEESSKKKVDTKGRKKVAPKDDTVILNFRYIDNQADNDAWGNYNIGLQQRGPSAMAKSMAINSLLRKKFPPKDAESSQIKTQAVNHLWEALEEDAVGYSLGAVVYIDDKLWDQDDIYMHEFSHIYFNIARDSEQVQGLLKEVVKNKELMADTAKTYHADLKVKITSPVILQDGSRVNVGSILHMGNMQGVSKEKYKVLKWSDQEVILEEAFVAYINGPLMAKYDRLFNLKNEPKRKADVQAYWKGTKNAVTPEESDALVEKISGDKSTQKNLDFIVNNFAKAFTGSANVKGRAMILNDKLKEEVDKLNGIQKEHAIQNEIPTDVFEEKQKLPEIDNSDDAESETGAQNNEGGVDSDWEGGMSDKSFYRMQHRSSVILDGFIKDYNKNLYLSAQMKAKEKGLPIEIVYQELRQFKTEFLNLMKDYKGSLEFMAALESTHKDNILMTAFNDHLNKYYKGQKYSILNSMHFVFSNVVTYPVVISRTDKNGNVHIEHAISSTEEMQIRNIERKFAQKMSEESSPLVNATADVIFKTTNEYSYDNLITEILGEQNTFFEIERILSSNRIAFKNGFTDKKTFFDHYFANGVPDAGLRSEMISNLVVTNRSYTSDSVVRGVDKDSKGNYNYTASKHATNSLSNQFAKYSEDLQKGMSRDEFLKEHTNYQEGGARVRNGLLEFIYDNYAKYQELPGLTMYVGSINESNNKNLSYKSSDPLSLEINDIVRFRQGTNGYLTTLNGFGDSKRSIMTNMPKYKMDDSSESKRALWSLLNIYKHSRDMIKDDEKRAEVPEIKTLGDLRKAISKEVAKKQKFYQENYQALKGIANLSFMYDNGKITKEGLDFIESYEFSTMVNSSFTHEQLTPSVPMFDINKRNKMNISPSLALSPKLRYEMMMMASETLEGTDLEVNDSGQYITDVIAKKISDRGQGVFDMNNGFKLVSHAVEKTNPLFKGKNVAMKGYTTIITEEHVKKWPKLKPIYDALNERQNRFDKWAKAKGVKTSSMLNDYGSDMDFIAIATPVSAEKGSMFSEYQMKQIEKLATVEAMEKNPNAYHKFLDEMYYSKQGEFVGLDGQNLGPQLLMDKVRDKSKVAVQFRSAILVAAAQMGQLEKAEGILRSYTASAENTLNQKLFSHVYTQEGGVTTRNLVGQTEFAKHLLNTANQEQINAIDKALLSMEGASILNPHMNDTIKNQIKNQVINFGNNLTKKGTIAQQKSEIGGHIPEGAKTDKPLQFYRTDRNGNNHPAEAIFPAYMNDGKTRKREYGERSSLKGKLITDRKLREDLGLLNVGEIDAFLDDHSFYHEGREEKFYYLPGERVLATRVPSSGPSFTGVMEVVDFDTTDASNIMVPTKFKDAIGSDDDGDQLFINQKERYGNVPYNDFLRDVMDYWLSAKMSDMLQTPLLDPDEVNEIIKRIGANKDKPMMFSSAWAQKNHSDALGANQTVGIAFKYHRMFNTLAAYGTKLVDKGDTLTISLNGQSHNAIQDFGKGSDSRIHRSNTITQIVLDSAKHGQADALNLNKTTIGYAMLLINLGFDLESVGMFLNEPIVKEFTQKRLLGMQAYSSEKVSARKAIFELGKKYGIKSFTANDKNKVIYYKENDNEEAKRMNALKLLQVLTGVEEDLKVLGTVLDGHKSMSSDPFVLEKQLRDFNQIVKGTVDSKIAINPKWRDSPEIKMYVDNQQEAVDLIGKMSIEFSPSNRATYRHIMRSLSLSVSDDFTAKKVSDLLKIYNEGKYRGDNNEYSRQDLETIISPDEEQEGSMIKEYREYEDLLKSDYTFLDEDTANSISALDKNSFMSRGVSIGMDADGNLRLATGKQAKPGIITEEEKKDFQKSFAELPISLQEKLITADLVINEWKGNNSIMPFFPDHIIKEINNGAEYRASTAEPDSNELTNEVRSTLINTLMNTSPYSFEQIYIDLNANKPGDIKDNMDHIVFGIGRYPNKNGGISESGGNYRKLKYDPKTEIQPLVYYKINRSYRGTPVEEADVFLEVKGYTSADEVKIMSKAKTVQTDNRDWAFRDSALRYLYENGHISIVRPTAKSSYNIDAIAIPDENTPKKKNTKSEVKKKFSPKIGRAAKMNFENYTGKAKLTFEEFVDAYEFKYPVAQRTRNAMYEAYYTDKDRANELAPKYTPEKLAFYDKEKKEYAFSDQELLDRYKEFGKLDVYAYSNILVPITQEITRRSIHDQLQLTKKVEGDKDISKVQAYFQTNNIGSDHPATQAVQRELEGQYKEFQNEKRKFTSRINKATDKLYKEKFNDSFSTIPFINKVSRAINVAFRNRKMVYEKLYGNITATDTIEEEGKTFKRIRLLPDGELQKRLNKGEISNAEYEFAQVFRETIGELGKNKGLKDFNTNGFVPAIAMTRMEGFAHRGLLGLFANSRSENEQIQDVKMQFQGQEHTFKFIEDYYRVKANNNVKNIKDLVQYKIKARKLMKQGINEDGSKLLVSKVATNTLLGDGMLERFTSSNFMAEENLMSMDLDKALHDFVHASIFVDGNGKFKGFLKLQAMVDGLIIHNRKKGFKNQNEFVKGVYKKGFLAQLNRKDEPPRDKIVNAMVRGNLLYVLGYKGLFLKKGVYAIGNIMAGKYHNVKNLGGKAWITGEKRFWGLTKESGLGTRKSANVLKNLNYMDINIYDEVSFNRSSGLDKVFTDVALSPMIYSEKWIQGVHFLGMLTNEQWNRFDADGNYKPGAKRLTGIEVAEIENQVKNSHGKGYQPTDQRLIQQYSWGKMIMQYARFIPTMYYERFSKEDVDIYGKTHVGSLRIVGEVINKIVTGEMSPKEFVAYRNKQSPERQRQLDSGLRGIGLTAMSAFVGAAFNLDTANELTGDANYVFNTEKLEYKLMPSLIRSLHNLFVR